MLQGMRLPADAAVLPVGGMRPVTRLEALLLAAGARLDRFVLEHFLRRNTFPAPRDGAALRGRLERARTFYADPRFAADPAAFFVPPAPRRAQLRRRGRLADGELLGVAYTTEFTPVFPEARDGGAATAAGQPGLARWWRHRRPDHPAM